MIQVLSKEFNSFLNSLIAYVVIGVFLTAIGLLMWVFPETSVLEYGYADMETLFALGPYVFIFLIPAITMRTFAEEARGGTLELLLTKPLSDWDIVLGKFLACFFLVILSLLPTVIYYFSVYTLGNPVGNIDSPGVMGSYTGLVLLGAVFCSIGILSSSLTKNQFIAPSVFIQFQNSGNINPVSRYGHHVDFFCFRVCKECLRPGGVPSRKKMLAQLFPLKQGNLDA